MLKELIGGNIGKGYRGNNGQRSSFTGRMALTGEGGGRTKLPQARKKTKTVRLAKGELGGGGR